MQPAPAFTDNQKRTNMKKIVMLLAAVCTMCMVSCNTKKEKEQEAYDPSEATIDSLRQALTQSQNESSDLIETLSQIQDGLDGPKCG